MSPTTRQRIIEYLSLHRQASVPELGQSLNMTRANMRYHLDKLVEEGAVELVTTQPREHAGRGRPTQVYRLSMSARPNNLAQLASLLLDLLKPAETGQSDPAQILNDLSLALAGSEAPPRVMTQRLNRAVQVLNQKRYQARWEARANAPHIIFRNCPYAAILSEHPELCRMDALLLHRLVSLPAEQLAKMDLSTGKPPACIFAIGAKTSLPSQD